MSDTTTPAAGEDESDLDGALRILRGMAEDDAGPLDMDEIPLWIAAPLLAELEGRDQAAADMAHRDDLARDVARTWEGLDEDERYGTDFALASVLDRLAAAYGTRQGDSSPQA